MRYNGWCEESFLALFERAMLIHRGGRLGRHPQLRLNVVDHGVPVAFECRVLFPGNYLRFAEDAVLHTCGTPVSYVLGWCAFTGGGSP